MQNNHFLESTKPNININIYLPHSAKAEKTNFNLFYCFSNFCPTTHLPYKVLPGDSFFRLIEQIFFLVRKIEKFDTSRMSASVFLMSSVVKYIIESSLQSLFLMFSLIFCIHELIYFFWVLYEFNCCQLNRLFFIN